MQTLKDVSEGIEPFPFLSYQRALWDKLNQGGFKQGQMTLYSAGRRSGKSYLNSLYGSTGIKSLYYKNLITTMKPEPKYKFSRANWYVAEYDNKHHFEVLEWCVQQFGPYPARPDAWSRWVNMYSEKIHFRDAKDYMFFLLRWS